jgi:sarcosine oxidase subunit beta
MPDKRYDLCIIGGGLLGTSTAFFAARSGLKVGLLEERDLAAGASGAAFGGVSVGIYGYSEATVPPAYVALSKASLALYHELQDELGPPLDLDAPGSIDPFYTEEGLARGRERVTGLQACDVDCELLDRKQIREIEPAISDVITGAIYCPVDAHVTPPCVVGAFAKAARQLGAHIETGARVLSLTKQGDRVTGLRASTGNISAGWIVNTAGIGASQLASTVSVNLPLACSRGQMFVTERVPPLLRTYVHNIKQTAVGTIVIGATRENGLTDTATTVQGAKEVLSWAVRLIPALAQVNLLRSWAGIRPVPQDGYPIIGPVEGLDRLLIAVMHRGVTLAPVIGEILVDLITQGQTRHEIKPFLLSRFANAAAHQLHVSSDTFYAS